MYVVYNAPFVVLSGFTGSDCFDRLLQGLLEVILSDDTCMCRRCTCLNVAVLLLHSVAAGAAGRNRVRRQRAY
jgi:hypothetical protein